MQLLCKFNKIKAGFLSEFKFLNTTNTMENQQRINRRRRRNLPAELKVEIVDCFPVENAAHFLANVPSRLIIHHCAPRIRRILKMIPQIAADYARTLPAANSDGDIDLKNGHKYTPEMDIFLRYGAAHCHAFHIWRGTGDGFVGYPANFFDDLIQHYYQTKVPGKAVNLAIALNKPALWPAALVQSQAGEIKLEELTVYNDRKYVFYILRNKNNPGIAFTLWIYFQGSAKCYQQMTGFFMHRV